MTTPYHLRRLIDYERRQYTASLEQNRKVAWGIIRSFNGSTTVEPLGDAWSWVAWYGADGSVSPVLNPTALREAGTRVLISREPKPPFRWQVVGIDSTYASETTIVNISQYDIGPHAENHQIIDENSPGADPVYVGQPMLMILKTVGNGTSLVVSTYSCVYNQDGVYRKFAGKTTDLTTYLPTTIGYHRSVLLYLNRDTVILKAVAGAEVIDSVPPIEPTPPAGVDAEISAWVTLTYGQTAVAQSDVKDGRDFLKSSAGVTDFDIDGLTEQTAPTAGADYLAIYDAGLAANRKVLLANLPGGASGATALFSQTVSKTVANTTDETDLMSAGAGSRTLPANLLEVGAVIRLSLAGHISTTATPNITFTAKLGGTELATTGAQAPGAGVTSIGWRLFLNIVCRSTGATGTVVTSGFVKLAGDLFALVKTTTTTIDTTISQLIETTVTWGTAHASNTITCQEAVVEHLATTGLAPVGPSDLVAIEIV